MMTINKNRKFEELISDTFGYISEVWRHFVPTLLRVNILYIFAVCALVYMAFDFAYGSLNFNFGAGLVNLDLSRLDSLYDIDFPTPEGWQMTLLSVLFIVTIICRVIYDAYTPIYMLLHKRHSQVPTYSQIIDFLKSHIGRIATFYLWSILLFIPVATASVLISLFLAITIVGIPLIFVYVVFIRLIFNMMFLHYMENENCGYFDALDMAWQRMEMHFFKNTGASCIICLISSLLASFLNIISNMTNVAIYTDRVFLGMTFSFLAIILHLLVSTLYSVNMSLIYFSSERQDTRYTYTV